MYDCTGVYVLALEPRKVECPTKLTVSCAPFPLSPKNKTKDGIRSWLSETATEEIL